MNDVILATHLTLNDQVVPGQGALRGRRRRHEGGLLVHPQPHRPRQPRRGRVLGRALVPPRVRLVGGVDDEVAAVVDPHLR